MSRPLLCCKAQLTLQKGDYLGRLLLITWALKSREFSLVGGHLWRSQKFQACRYLMYHCWLKEGAAIRERKRITLKSWDRPWLASASNEKTSVLQPQRTECSQHLDWGRVSLEVDSFHLQTRAQSSQQNFISCWSEAHTEWKSVW